MINKCIRLGILTFIAVLAINSSVWAREYKAKGIWYMPIGLNANLSRSFGASDDWYGRIELAPLGFSYGKLGIKISAFSAYIESNDDKFISHRFISPVYFLYTPYMNIKASKSLSDLIYIYGGGAAWGNSADKRFFDAGIGITHRFKKWITARLQAGVLLSSWRKPRTYASLNLGWGGVPIAYGVEKIRIELKANMKLKKAGGIDYLDAGDKGTVVISIANEGNEDSHDININLSPSEYKKHIILEQAEQIEHIDPGEKKSVNVFFRASRQLPTGEFQLGLTGEDDDGHKVKVQPLSIKTRSLMDATGKPKLAPYPLASLKIDPKSGAIKAGSEVVLSATVENRGKGNLYGCYGVIVSDYALISGKKFLFGKVRPGETVEEVLSVKIPRHEKNREVKFQIVFHENNDYWPEPIASTLQILGLPKPDFQYSYRIIDDNSGMSVGNGDSILQKGESIDIVISFQNWGDGNAKKLEVEIATPQGKGLEIMKRSEKIGKLAVGANASARLNLGTGEAQNVSVLVEPSDPNVLYQSENNRFDLGTIRAGKWKKFTFSIFVNKRFSDVNVPIDIQVKERRERYNLSFPLTLPLNKPSKTLQEIVVQGKEDTGDEAVIERVPPLSIDVDVNIPKTPMKNPDAIAVVIGNQEYTRKVPPVKFAIRDATIVKEYLINTLGYKEGNILFELNATKARFEAIFGTGTEHKGLLYNYVKRGKSDVFVYYSGHGAPDPESKQGYLVPVDCDPAMVKLNGYSLSTLYSNLSQIPARSFTVVIDACFSGESFGGQLISNISPVFITVDNPLMALPKATIFTSATGEQVSCWYPKVKHSLFTYFFLKGIQGVADTNNDKKVIVSELEQFITDKTEGVPYYARRLHSREQTPVVSGDKEQVIVRFK